MRKLIGLGLAASFPLLLAGCNPNLDITFVNRTSGNLRAEVSSSGFVEIEAGSTKTFTFDIDDENRIDITVVDEDGDIVLDEITTKNELEERDYRIVIEEPSSRGRSRNPKAASTLPP